MSVSVADDIKLYGTEESVVPIQRLTAGPLTCDFDQGALRYIKIYGQEAIRNIAFVVRDKDWGTYQPTLSNVQIEQHENTFAIIFDAVCKDNQQEIHYHAEISGAADGTLTFTGDYTTITDFLTNRTGFVVLHPVQGVAGHPVTVEHVNGKINRSEFPELVDPIQPFKDIRALTHEVIQGVDVCCRMTGDTFEMEDHRQWNDASYKTYVRPIGLPWPFTIPARESLQQSVELTITTAGATAPPMNNQEPPHCSISISAGDPKLQMPRVGLGLEPQHHAGAQARQEQLKQLGLQQLVIWHDLDQHNADHLKQAAAIAHKSNTELVLHAVIPDKDYQSEVAELAEQCSSSALTPSMISVAPAMYLNSIMPGTNWPDVTELKVIYDEVRTHFPGVTLGGGMLSFFPELNRHRPPTEHLDYVTHASNTITHACDDITVTENLEAVPYIIKTCRSFTDGKPYHVGPSSIGMRFNPYGSKTMDNPNNARIAMARMDPRQRGLINAAWTVGYVAHMARGGVDSINLHAPTGEFGIFNHPEDWSRPGFDDTNKEVYPVYHVVAGFAKAAGKTQLLTQSSTSREIEAVAYEDKGESIIWIANLTQEKRRVEVNGVNINSGKISALTLETFDDCTKKYDGFERTTTESTLSVLELGPYAVVRIVTPAS